VLCQRLADGADAVRTSPAVRALAESIAGRVRDGMAPDQLADDFDELEEQLLRAGHAAGLSAVRSSDPVPGAGDGHRVLEVLTCPGGTCDRVAAPGADPVPCLVFRRPMAVTRLPS
jgi:hypothetical protein